MDEKKRTSSEQLRISSEKSSEKQESSTDDQKASSVSQNKSLENEGNSSENQNKSSGSQKIPEVETLHSAIQKTGSAWKKHKHVKIPKSTIVDFSKLSKQRSNDSSFSSSDDEVKDHSNTRKMTLCWEKINAFAFVSQWNCCSKPAPNKDSPVHILRDVSGRVLPGQFLAILGGSGAGKTTLLNILTGRVPSNLMATGLVCVNGKPLSDHGKKLLSYIQQDDIFIGSLTVKEHLTFQAELRMDRSLSYDDKIQRVEEILKELGLVSCADTTIGDPGNIKGASGGERKRLAFASELLTNPQLMICDEPTTGLDSLMAKNVVAVLSNIAMTGKTIVCTIHQPSSETYEYFHQLLLMSQGRTVFQGTTKEALEFFSTNGYVCPQNYNPADFFINTISVHTSSLEKVEQLCDNYESTVYAKSVTRTINSISKELRHRTSSFIEYPMGKFEYKTLWYSEACILYRRAFLDVSREPGLTVIRLTQTIFMGVLFALVFWGQKIDQNGIMNLNGFMFLMITSMSFQNSYAVITTFSENLFVFYREHDGGICRTIPYFIAKSSADMPLFFLIPSIFTCIVYFCVGLRAEAKPFFITLAVLVIVSNIACSFAYMISCIAADAKRALAIAPAVSVVMMIFGGFFLKNQTFPKYLAWLKYFSWFNFSFEILVLNQWSDIKQIKCGESFTCLTSGQEVINSMKFGNNNWNFDFGMLIVLFLFYRLVGVIALLIRMKYCKRN